MTYEPAVRPARRLPVAALQHRRGACCLLRDLLGRLGGAEGDGVGPVRTRLRRYHASSASAPVLAFIVARNTSTLSAAYSHPAAVRTERILRLSARLMTPCLLYPNLFDTRLVLNHFSISL